MADPAEYIHLYRGQPLWSKVLPGKNAGGAGGWFTPISEKAAYYRNLSGPLSGKIVEIKKEPISNWKQAVHRAELKNSYNMLNTRLSNPDLIQRWDKYGGPLSKGILDHEIEGKLDPNQAYKKIEAIFDDYKKGWINFDELKALLPEGYFDTTYNPPKGKAKTAWGKTLKPMVKPLASVGAKALGPISFLMADTADAPTMDNYGKHQHESKYVPNVMTYNHVPIEEKYGWKIQD